LEGPLEGEISFCLKYSRLFEILNQKEAILEECTSEGEEKGEGSVGSCGGGIYLFRRRSFLLIEWRICRGVD